MKREEAEIMRKLTILSAALAAVITLGALTTPVVAKPFKLAHSTWVGYGPLFIARDKGYFKEEGVDVELVNMEDVKIRFAALAAGRIDALATTVDTVLLYLKPGGPKYRYVFALDDSKGGDGVVADKSIKTIADLKGKKVAFTEGSVSQFYINVLLKQAGLSESDIEVVNMTAGDAGSAFVTGRVDAAVTWEPWLTRGKQSPHGHLLHDSSMSPGLITDVVVVPENVLKARAEEIKAIYRAWVRAVDFVKSNPDESYEIMAKGVGGWLKDPKVFAETLSGISYYGKTENEAFFGKPGKLGGLRTTLQNAIDIWSGFGKLQVKVTPEDLVSFVAVAQ
ncbi:MAG: taurine ABC transporter substrate-binding protein [Alphaproteobacteria bacterium]|nr:MAG: taurine ABC transporter substrate-binding protein [Alphaproteobacteria bacterium]